MGSAPLVLPPYGLHGGWRVRGTNNYTTNMANSKQETTRNAKRSCSELEMSDLESSAQHFKRWFIIQGASSDTPLSKLSRVCTVVQYAVLEAIRAVYGIWQI